MTYNYFQNMADRPTSHAVRCCTTTYYVHLCGKSSTVFRCERLSLYVPARLSSCARTSYEGGRAIEFTRNIQQYGPADKTCLL